MKHIKLYENFNQEQSKYEDWEKGIIMAWGHVLYISFHSVPNTIQKIVSVDQTKQVFREYFNEAEADEDMQDWMSDAPPTMNKGYAVYDKDRLSDMMTGMANKTKIKTPLLVYRTGEDFPSGWNSYTINKDNDMYGEFKKQGYELPIGYPVIFADDIADKDEVILNLSDEDKKRFVIK